MPPLIPRSRFYTAIRTVVYQYFPWGGGLFDILRKMRHIRWHFRHPSRGFMYKRGYVTASKEMIDDDKIINRLIESYHAQDHNAASDVWKDAFETQQQDIHQALLTRDKKAVKEIFSNPISSNLFYSFEDLSRWDRRWGISATQVYRPALILDSFISLAEAMGVRRMDNPERYGRSSKIKICVEDIIHDIEEYLGTKLDFPNPYPKEYGLKTRRGVISTSVPRAIYQAWRISQFGHHVCEIGAGLGRTAFYAKYFDIRDYTLVDIPISLLAQGYFLARTVGEMAIALPGESAAHDSSISLMTPESFLQSDKTYDVVLNVDSMTEISTQDIQQYLEKIAKNTSTFISINHETNKDRIFSMVKDQMKTQRMTRYPFWLRRGYVEEIYTY